MVQLLPLLAVDVSPRTSIRFDGSDLRLESVVDLAKGRGQAELSRSEAFVGRISRGAAFVDRVLAEDGVIYGVTTGYGDSCDRAVAPALVPELSRNLYTYHGVGLGSLLGPEETRAVLAVRLATLCRGHSGVSYGLLEQLERLLKEDILPAIPEEGSVGASGDLTPLSYVAAVLCGEREVLGEAGLRPAAEVLASRGISPLRLRPKEGLALMNGTSVMTALACLAFQRARYLSRVCSRVSAMAVYALDGNPHHFDARLFELKPHPGQQLAADRIRADLGEQGPGGRNERRLQDRYSLRCSPHVIGVLEDALPFFRGLIERELNSANDNPLIDVEGGQVLHGGHFYGGHIAFAMDGLKQLVANLADLLDRQVAQVLDAKMSHGLPANLSGAPADEASAHHGLKALGISTSAWTAEALKLTMPASVFSRSTESHNQDKVSMGTIAARDCLRVLTLTEQVAAAALVAMAQGVELRRAHAGAPRPAEALIEALGWVREDSAFVSKDRRLDVDLRAVLGKMRVQAWPLYGGGEA
jgi:histidine ammonia-lyase